MHTHTRARARTHTHTHISIYIYSEHIGVLTSRVSRLRSYAQVRNDW